jgi:two-component system chemotaxis sensor kinase CheA
VRIATKKLDRILDLVGELVVSKSMITAALRKGGGLDPDVREALGTLERHTRELQDSVMAVRMVPMSSVFSRFPRVVRELGTKLGKDVRLELEGTETEIDRAMVEQLADPLTHLVRNAVDHGLETAASRTQDRKPAAGHLVLSASHRGGNVVIEIRDDGRGLDLERVREKAIERGLLAAGERATSEQLHMLVFEPGFSTASAVTDVSGRGVGMDVVKRNVEALGGALHFTSEPGRGSVVRLQLPLTMAIIDGLMLRVGHARFVVPLLSVVESLRPSTAMLRTVLGKARVMTFRGKAIPLVILAEVLDVPDGTTEPTRGIVVVVESGGDMVGLVIDELLADGQVVVKSLEANYRRLEGLAGATVMGDGSVALILDVPGLARLAAQATTRLCDGRAA